MVAQAQPVEDGGVVAAGIQEGNVAVLVVFPVAGFERQGGAAGLQTSAHQDLQVGGDVARTRVEIAVFVKGAVADGSGRENPADPACIAGPEGILLLLEVAAQRVQRHVRGQQRPVGRAVPADGALDAAFVTGRALDAAQRVEPVPGRQKELALDQAAPLGGQEGRILGTDPVSRFRAGEVAFRQEEQRLSLFADGLLGGQRERQQQSGQYG